MTKNQVKFLKLLKKHGTMTAPQICEKLNIKKSNIYATDYSELLQYIDYPNDEHEFDSFFTIKHYNGDEATSCKSEFSLTTHGKELFKHKPCNKMNVFIIATTLIGLIIALLNLLFK